jgi:polyferredoxin
LFISRWFPIVLQLITLVVFGLLVAGGLGVSAPDAAFAKVLRNTNLANLVVWSYWWPLIIVVSILAGRVWCTVCPMELISSLAVRIGLRLKVPKTFKSGWVMTIFFALILVVGIHTFAIHRHPHRMALYMLILLGTAVLISLLYEKWAFCNYVCPVGHLLGLYALISPLEWRCDDPSICSSCKTKECIAKDRHYRISGRSCTSGLYPAGIKDNRDCLVCTQCLKACPSKNLRLSVRKPYADFFGDLELRPAQTVFVLVVSAFVVYEILSEWAPSKAVLTWVPRHFVSTLGIAGPMAGAVSAIVMFIVFPAILLLSVIVLARIRSRASLGVVAGSFALLLVPTTASAHLIKAMLKTTSRIPYWPYVSSDPTGIDTARRIIDKNILLDLWAPDMLYGTITSVTSLLLVVALAATLLIFRKSAAIDKLDRAAKASLLFGAVVYWSIFGLTIFQVEILSKDSPHPSPLELAIPSSSESCPPVNLAIFRENPIGDSRRQLGDGGPSVRGLSWGRLE